MKYIGAIMTPDIHLDVWKAQTRCEQSCLLEVAVM